MPEEINLSQDLQAQVEQQPQLQGKPVPQPAKGRWPNSFQQKLPSKKFLKIFVSSLAIVVILLLIAIFLFKFIGRKRLEEPVVTPTPSPKASPSTEIIPNPSRYVTDSAVLETEEELDGLDNELSETVIEETTLLPPSLDFEINFKE